jgi:tetratricopeptide (TPR) repeat protein
MNKIILTIALCLAASVSVKLQTVSDADKAALEQLNQRVIEASNTGRLNDAEDLARQALERAIKLFGGDNEETAVAFFNLGEIYLSKKEYKKAIENLHPALGIYQQNQDKFPRKIAQTALSLGVAYGFERNNPSAEKYILIAVDAAEKAYGKENKEILRFIINLRNFYVFSGDFNKADDQFANHYSIAAKIFAEDSEELQKIEEEHYCFAVRFFSDSTAKRRIVRFRSIMRAMSKKKAKEEPTFDLFEGEENNEPDSETGGDVINGKAKKLAKPSFPSKASRKGIGGKIPVKITIDETGKVVEAKTFCGNADLRKASEKAALKSKFTPTLVKGKPIKVTGYIVYNYVFR